MLRFQLPEAGQVSAWISSYCDADTVRQLVTGDLPAGEVRHDVLLLGLGYGDVTGNDSMVPLAVTDVAGHFTLDQGCLPFGHTFPQLYGSGSPADSVEVTRNVRVWAFSTTDGSRAASDWIVVNPHHGAEVEIAFDR